MTQLTINQKTPAVIASEAIACRDMAQAELLPEIIRQYKIVLAYSGQAGINDAMQLNVVARMIEQDLRQTKCTIEQFKIAVQEGMKSGDVFSANAPATYNKWVRTYLDKVNSEIFAYRSKVLAETNQELTEDEKLRRIVEGVMHCYYEYKQHGTIRDAGSATYHFLESIGLINIDLATKKQMFEAALPEAINRLKIQQMTSDRHTARMLHTFIRDALEGKRVDDVRFEQQLICRTNILKDFFNQNTLTHEALFNQAGRALDGDSGR